MSMYAKRFQLRNPRMTNDKIAELLGIEYSIYVSPVIFRENGKWVGSRIKNIIALKEDRADLHEKARKFADEIIDINFQSHSSIRR